MKHRPTGTIYHPIKITIVHTLKTYKSIIVPGRKHVILVLNGSAVHDFKWSLLHKADSDKMVKCRTQGELKIFIDDTPPQRKYLSSA
jgi:hypothetical protein